MISRSDDVERWHELRLRRAELERSVRERDPEMRDVVIDGVREDGHGCVQRRLDVFAEDREASELVEGERLATVRVIATPVVCARKLQREKLGDAVGIHGVGRRE